MPLAAYVYHATEVAKPGPYQFNQFLITFAVISKLVLQWDYATNVSGPYECCGSLRAGTLEAVAIRGAAYAFAPPSTVSVIPVTKFAAGLARNTTASAISRGSA